MSGEVVSWHTTKGGTGAKRPPSLLEVKRARGGMNVADVVVRIVHSEDVIGHEEVDADRVERLLRRLQSDGVLKNPPLVAAEGSRYVLLDGATRVAALRELGIRDLVVQVIDYDGPGVQLHSWRHVIAGLRGQDLVREVQACPGMAVASSDVQTARTELSRNSILCYLMLRGGDVLTVRGGEGLEAKVALLNRLVRLYRGRAQVYRVMSDDLDALLNEYPDLSAICVFPCYTCAEILSAALNGAKLPMGITRHTILGRVLGLNVDLVMLDSDIPLEQKNVWLQGLIKSRIKGKRVRLYPEPVFRFDE